MAQSRFIIGIDLGTTNSAVAFVDLQDPAEQPPIRLFQVPQLVDVGKVDKRPGLPSFLYLPGPHELPEGATSLPWAAGRDYAVGTFAREQGALVPARLVSSAKSWLCHAGVDRESDLLPWGSPSDVPHISPIEVSSRYLRHVREAWDIEMSEGRPEWCVAKSDVVLTVPASFDEVARELTVRAARQAGYENLTLLEEPQAAFYSWVRSQGDFWHEQLSDGDTVLVCDVGGGTTDFSLIAVRGEGAETTLERVAVGDHLMLGGDNMDLALARHLERRLVKRAGELSAKQWGALVHACRQAKENLLGMRAEDRFGITIAGRGSRVIGGSLKIDLFRDEVEELVLDGFFPKVGYDEAPPRARVGLQELGLPYASDPAITRNLAAFLKRHGARPDAVLFNGGAMKAQLVQDRVIDTVSSWFAGQEGGEPFVLESGSLDLAVALGAATYGLVRAGDGVRIRGGTARAYYVGVGGARGSGKQAVCLIPFGVEEGDEVHVDRRFELLTSRPVSFPLHSTTARLGHDAGELVKITDDVFLDLPPIHTVLSHAKSAGGARTVPVKLAARLTEIGTLQLWCDAEKGDQRWDLEFSVRDDGGAGAGAGGGAAIGEGSAAASAAEAASAAAPIVGDARVEVDDATRERAAELMERVFHDSTGRRQSRAGDPLEGGGGAGGERGPRTLLKTLEELFEAERLSWPGPLVRDLWQPLWQLEPARERSAEHEAAWLNMAGIFLRPGFGDPLDAQRVDQLWSVWRQGLLHESDLFARVGWWVLWRRVSGGLERGQQLELTNKLSPPLLSGAALKAAGAASKGGKGGKSKGKKGKAKGAKGDGGMNRQELAEMWRCAASLERTPVRTKEGLGDVALRNAVAGRGNFAYWALGRLGARVPLYGATDDVVGREKVEAWLERLLGLDWGKHRGVALAVVQLARLCGDDARDIDDGLRQRVVQRLRAADCAEGLVKLVLEVSVLQGAEQAQLFGDALPAGLRIA
ncbi:MAG: Hsp70 family protein [Myxococcales bacterium]|nr:Hsp70 family protein [Myxococcales bacterium]